VDGINVAQTIVSAIAVTLIATPLIVLAYLAGRRSQSEGRNHRLDQLRPEVHLNGSTWRVDIDGDSDTSPVVSIQLDLVQSGSRIVATGRSPDGTRHCLEGVIHHGRMCCVSIDDNHEGAWLGTITAELCSGQRQMSGLRSHWSPKSQTMIMRRILFTRLDTTASAGEQTVNSSRSKP
jgi:hypothetical protein